MRNSFVLVLACLLSIRGEAADYKKATPGYHYEFPRDYFSHPDYKTEWWYYTGNLRSADGRRFGFELTFFRQAVARDADSSPWHIHDLYMAHLALSDLHGRSFYHDERINRAGPGIAGIDQRTGLIWNGNWQVQITAPRQALRALNEQFSIQLDLASAKPPVIQGEDGISRKTGGVGHASHYISLTRLTASGKIEVGGAAVQVEGSAWMDHEFFSDSMDASESGWDWLSMQLDDNSEIMLYRLRHRDGSVDPYSSGAYIDPQGNSTFLSLNDFTMTPAGDTWTSPQTGGVYPVRWHVAIPRLGLEAVVSTALANQELPSSLGPSYWEGVIDLTGTRVGNPLHGVGYLEMTGYSAPMHE